MATILDKIASYKRQEVAAAKAGVSEEALRDQIANAESPRGFHAALRLSDL